MDRKPVWALAPVLQGTIVLAVVGMWLLFAFVLMPIFTHDRGANAAMLDATPAPLPSGFFQLTNLEWQGLRFARVDEVPFPSVDETEGTIAAADDATTQVLSPYTGRVTAVYATVGDSVTRGAPLFAVDGGEYAQAENDLVTAIETLRTARIQQRVTALNRRRLLALQKSDGAAAKDVEQSAADLSTAQTAVTNDATAVALVRSRLRILGMSDAEIFRLERLGHVATLATDVVVPTPISGVVTQRSVGIGQYVDSAANGSSNALFTITDLSRVFFVANVPETSIALIHIGDPLKVRMLAFPGRVFAGVVQYIAPSVDPNTHRIFVRAEVDNTDGFLKPGMFGTVRISTRAPMTMAAVPEDAVIYEGDTARVWIAGPNETLALRYIRTGKTIDGMVQVSAGLQAGDRVVTSGTVFIDRALRGDN